MLKVETVIPAARERLTTMINARDALHSLLDDVQYEEHLLRDYVMSVGYQ